MTTRAPIHHRLRPLTGRDPDQPNRAATPLELLFDLCFVVAFGVAADQLAHLISVGDVVLGVWAFSFSILAICLAWINFSWFSSAYDTDDWFYRVGTLVQMIGVIIFALGIPEMVHSLEAGEHINNRIVVAGYVVIRIAMVTMWLRAARADSRRRSTALSYAFFISIAQVAWVVLAIVDIPTWIFLVCVPILFLVEFAGPVLSERKTEGTPWNPHHIAERYGLLTIIALGEGIFGTVATVSALVEHQGWTMDAVLVVIAGVGITFALWWTYFIIPSGPVLARHRSRAWPWGYGHILIFAAIAATGAGLHVVAYVIEGETSLGTTGAILAVAIPLAVFSVTLFTLYTYLVGEFDPFHVWLFGGTLAALAIAVACAAAGASIGFCLVILTLSPVVVVVGFETVGHRHQTATLQRALR